MTNNIKTKLLFSGYLVTIVGLLLYSYTQIDLNLTLSQVSIWQTVQKFFQQIGYFNRPLSAIFYLSIILILFVFYFLFLFAIRKKKIDRKNLWKIVLLTGFILFFSYNAFSYDLFNYIFDAKIVTFYKQNPFVHKALDFPQDPMLNFMRWTHRIYPYGPTWLFITVPLSFLGFQIFLPTFFLFKALAVASFLGTTYYISKILKKISPENELLGVAFFALNPLIIIESLVSAHNDIVMLFLLASSIYYFIDKKYIRSIILFGMSIGIKYATVFLLPFFLVIFFLQRKERKTNWMIIFLSMFAAMIIPVVLASFRTNFQPWYLLYILPFAAFLGKKNYIVVPSMIISFFALLQYAPFIYLGNWDPPVPVILHWLNIIPIVISGFFVIGWFLKSLLKIDNR